MPYEVFETLVQSQTVKIEKIVSNGQASEPGFWYDQDEHEWVLVLEGQAKISIEGENDSRTLLKGDYINIPKHLKHRVEETSNNTIWLAVFYR